MLAFLVGLLLGLLSGVALVGFLAYRIWACSNHAAMAKFFYGLAQALAPVRNPSGGLPPAKPGDGQVAKKAVAGKTVPGGVWV